MLGDSKGARSTGNIHDPNCGGRAFTARERRDLAKLNSRNAAKALLSRAWRNVTPEHLAEKTHEEPRRFFERISMSEQTDAPLRWLLDVEGPEFEAAIVEIRRERAAREQATLAAFGARPAGRR